MEDYGKFRKETVRSFTVKGICQIFALLYCHCIDIVGSLKYHDYATSVHEYEERGDSDR